MQTKLLQSFLILKNEERKIVPAVDLNELICQFMISVRRKGRMARRFARSFYDTSQLVNKNRTHAFSMK